MTEQNVSLIKLSILLSRFSDMAKYNLSSGRESPKKAQSHNAQKSLQKKGPRPPAYNAPPQGPGSGARRRRASLTPGGRRRSRQQQLNIKAHSSDLGWQSIAAERARGDSAAWHSRRATAAPAQQADERDSAWCSRRAPAQLGRVQCAI